MQTITVPGICLIPGFSVYLIEVIRKEERWYYIGMTGDNYYPSARSAFHRLSGHLELLSRSTQNQLMRALKKQVFKSDNPADEDYKELSLKMHHFPIEGYVRWPGTNMSKAEMRRYEEEHNDYLKARKNIARLESQLIFEFKHKLLNKEIRNSNDEKHYLFDKLKQKIQMIVNEHV